jgi:hypothetical protein
MKFYFPDSKDTVSPSYDFTHDKYHESRIPHCDDVYAHEILEMYPYDGILVSKAIVDGGLRNSSKYSDTQRQRIYREGVSQFFRLSPSALTLGDCGAFSYVSEESPPYTVDEVVSFYTECGFQAGISMDHIVLGYDRDAKHADVDPDWVRRQAMSINLGGEFFEKVSAVGTPFQPVGAAQGWSPVSYAESVSRLQDFGFRRIALGGVVALKTSDILDVLTEVSSVRAPSTELHLLGVARAQNVAEFASLGVASFDSTSPFRQSFMDDRHNYHTHEGTYQAIRVPQVDKNPMLRRAITAGEVSEHEARSLEQESLRVLRGYDNGTVSLQKTLSTLREYEFLVAPHKKSRISGYERTLQNQPWKACSCRLCSDLGIEIMIFRGSERNKRRGFHNLTVLGEKINNFNKTQIRSGG